MAKILDTFKDRELELGPLVGPASSSWQHWKLARDADGVAWLGFDKQNSGANTLNEETLGELNSILVELERDPPKGLVLRSLKRSGFIAGADINQFRDKSAADVAANLTNAHAIVDQLDNLKLPTVAVIHGFCLGGGLEIALACDYRIAIDSARLGFPEVMLGLHPGLGGTVRLPRLINPVEAMTAMLTGRNLDARRSKRLGLVDAVTQERHVAAAVKDAVAGKLRTNRASTSVALMNLGPARTMLARKMRSETAKKAPEKHYPAPYALIDLWEKHGGDRRTMQRQEVESFGRLLATPTSQNLVRVFFLREKLKGNAGGRWPGERVHVIGAGTMGADIAAWCAWNGLTVTLADMKSEPLGAAIKRATRLFQRRAHGKSIAVRDALDRLIPDLKGEGARHADLIIEAVPEVLGLKQKIFAACEAVMKPDAVLATNTSSIPLEQLREGLKRPERFLGIHFFNPVPVLQLVEVVHHDKVAQDVLASANSFLGRIDKLPVPIKSAPGFLVNRALMP
jgi:3-hydroxyacyl-CoA dehydrogenase/enoyl-CoA hydratase/3-hydroxybutyryl-CoA epimerase